MIMLPPNRHNPERAHLVFVSLFAAGDPSAGALGQLHKLDGHTALPLLAHSRSVFSRLR